jgi:dolichol-phosphate mannosyltransferase
MVVAGLAMATLALLAVPLVAYLKAKGLYMFAQGLATTCILMLFLGGIQLMSMGVLGAYIGRIYDEAKRRPKFIVEESLGFSEPVPRSNQSGTERPGGPPGAIPEDSRDF